MAMTFFHRAADGSETDVTQSVQCLYDLVISSMDWGSGFLTAEDAEPVVKVAELGGFPDAARAREYVDDKRHSEEKSAFISSHDSHWDVHTIRPSFGGWVQVPHDHVWSSVGRCMWHGCDAREVA